MLNPPQGPPSPPPQGPPAPPPQSPPVPPAQGPPAPPPPPGHPNGDLLGVGRRRDFVDICVPLYNALMIGDWDDAQQILNGRQYLLRSSITENFEIPLHIAASAQHNPKSIEFVEKLVNAMDPADLLLQNRNGNTALSFAATSGNVKFAQIMVMGNRDLPTIANNQQMMPLYIAVMFRHVELVNFLYGESQQLGGRGWTDDNRSWLFLKSIEAELFDFALQILDVRPELAQNEDALATLARNPSVFNEIKPHFFRRVFNSIFCSKVESVAMDTKAMQVLRKIWRSIEEMPKVEIDRILRGPVSTTTNGIDIYPKRILFIAAEKGNAKFLAELIRRYPDLIWKRNDDGLSIFHVAVSHLHESIYNLLHELGSLKGMITPYKDAEDNNMLHLVGKKPEKSQLRDVSGVAFQMQRKLLWFEEVESMIPAHYKEKKNGNGLTPYQLFTENHKELVSEAEKWMKGTASKCMVVAALIATVVFAVAYTIPGGYEQKEDIRKNGFPVFLHYGPFLAFVILDAISLILSSTSILVFLSILTSRYAQEDFKETLPKLLFRGLLMLLFSVVTMMISFSVSFYVIYRGKFIAIALVISVLALIPIGVYATLQFPLLKDVFRSSYGTSHLFKPKKRMLYYQNPRV